MILFQLARPELQGGKNVLLGDPWRKFSSRRWETTLILLIYGRLNCELFLKKGGICFGLDAGIEPRTVATIALAVRNNIKARSHPHLTISYLQFARSHPYSARSHPQLARSHPKSARSHPHGLDLIDMDFFFCIQRCSIQSLFYFLQCCLVQYLYVIN